MNETMRRFVKSLYILSLGIGVIKIPFIRSAWIKWTAPQMRADDLKQSPLTLEDQRRLIIDFRYRVCVTVDPCIEQHESKPLRKSLQLSYLKVPSNLPDSVRENLKIYLEAMINRAKLREESHSHAGEDGGSFWPYLKYWEMDLCSFESIPQKVSRLYNLDTLTHSKLASCSLIKQLFEEQNSSLSWIKHNRPSRLLISDNI